MRDLLPEETRRRRALSRRVLDHFSLHGYQPVMPPAFELAEVLERGLGALDPSDVLRFVEPESGEVAALRPDVTPQIARMVATRLGGEPWPIRLSYEGTIVRRRQGRARRHRQVPQAGVELYGAAGQAGDLEILRLAASVVEALGLDGAVIDLGHAAIARSLLATLPAPLGARVGEALAHKDQARIAALLEGRAGPSTAAILELSSLQSGAGEAAGDELLKRAAPLFAGTPAEAPLRELSALWEAARSAPGGLAGALRLDLGEVRGFAYYTGLIFHLLAPGPGEPIGSGGRYDDLLGRFDAPMPAVGFALHLDAVAWAREHAQIRDERPPSAIVTTLAGAPAEPLLAALRALGVRAIAHPPEGCLVHAVSWRYSHVIAPSAEPGLFAVRRLAGDGALGPIVLESRDPGALARAVARLDP